MTESSASIRILPITAELFPSCWQLRLRALHDHPDAFGQPYAEAAALSQSEVRHSFDSFWNVGNNLVFGAVADDGTVAGMTGVAGWNRPKMRHRMDIWGVYVAPEFRGQGNGDRLLDAAIAHARSIDGVLQLHLQVVSTNVAAVRSYERAGFVRWGQMPRADIIDGQALDNDFMVLTLDSHHSSARTDAEGTHS